MVNVIVQTAGTSGPRGTGWLSGTGAPSNSIGFDGDLYLDTTNTSVYYGPKTGGLWGSSHQFTVLKSNPTATTNPTVNDDDTQGYVVGSFWVNTTGTNVYFVASSVDTGAAVWVPVLPVGTSVNTVAAGNDSRIVNALQSGAAAGGDLTGTYPDPNVTSTHLAVPLPLNQGGTGSATQNFVDLTGSQTIAGVKNFTGEILVPTPTNTNDAATKNYVDLAAGSGVLIHPSAAAGTTTALPTNTYFNGTGGVGATLTATAPGVLIVDGYTPVLNDRVLVKNEAVALGNGIYVLTTVGTVSVPYVLTRAVDMDEDTEIRGSFVFLSNGSQAGSGWIVVGSGPFTVGTTPIVWTQATTSGNVTVGVGLTQVGNEISLTVPVDAGNLPSATTVAFGIVEYNSSTANIQPLGPVSLGATGKAADAGHVHPTDGVVTLNDAATTVTSETSYNLSPAVGTSTNYARQDHTHGTPPVSNTAPSTTLAIGTVASAGVDNEPSRSDHVHPMATAGVPDNSAVGDTASVGSATTFAASDHRHGRESFGAVIGGTTYGQSVSTGTSTSVSHADHTHGTPPLTNTAPTVTEAIGTAAALGTAGDPARADHVHPMAAAGAPTNSAVGDINVTGVATTFAASDHRHGRESFGAVTALGAFNTPSSSGTATTVSHSDHVHGAPALPSATTGSLGIVQLAGDLAGTAASPVVARVNGVSVTGTPTFGQTVTASTGTTAAWSILPTFHSTGIRNGGVMTQNGGNPAAFDITAAVGYIVDYATSPTNPTVTPVTISAQTVTLGPSQTTQVVNYWYANAAGTILSQTTSLTPVQRRTNIFLGITWSVLSTGALYNIYTAPVTLNQPTELLFGTQTALGTFSTSGNLVSANGANLNVNKSAGTLFTPGFGYAANGVNNPNQVTSPSETAATFRYVTQLTNSQSATRTTVDVANYDVGGVVTLIPGGGSTSTIHRVFLMPSGVAGAQIIIQYGQANYSSLANATAAIGVEPFVLNPDIDAYGTLLCYLVCTKSATALNNTGQATFRTAARFALP